MDLDELRVFVSVVDRGSLAAASKSLRFPIATLRRRLNELEARLGVKLLERNHQGAVLTGAGSVLVEKARGLLNEVQSLSDLVRAAGTEPSGEVRVAIPLGLPPGMIALCLELVMGLYPKVLWKVSCLDDPASALSGDAHVAFAMTPRAPDGPWIAKKLMTITERLLATPEYLDKHGTPQSVEDLRAHRLLVWQSRGRDETELTLKDGSRVTINPALAMNDVFLLRRAALRGLGIVYAPDGPLPLELLIGEEALVPVLANEVEHKNTVWVLTHPATHQQPYGGALIEQLTRMMSAFK